MIGESYWATGITLKWVSMGSHGQPAWGLHIEFYDNGFCDQESSEGTLRMRYLCEDLPGSIDILLADAERLGIGWKEPTIYMEGDGEWDDREYPEGWRETVNAEAERIGWRPCYRIGVEA